MPEAQGSAMAMPPIGSWPWRRSIPLALFVLLPGILVFSSVSSGQFLYGSDAVGGLFHVRAAIQKAFWELRLPVWEPHVMAGQPLLADGQSSVLYPPTWLLLVWSVGTFWTVTQAAHLTLAGVFARAWLKRGLGVGEEGATLGGILYLLSGFVVSHLYLGHINHVWAYAWIPALLWRLERFLAAPTPQRGVLIAGVLAMLYLAGVPQYVFFAGLLVLARLFPFVVVGPEGRRGRAKVAGQVAAWLLLGLLACAPQVLSTVELVTQAQRTSINTYEFVTSFSVAPIHLWTLLSPTFFGDACETPFWAHGSWEASGFVGLAGLGLAALGAAGRHPQRRLWLAIALVSVLLALGSYTPAFRIFFHLVPGASLFRAPARMLLLFSVAVSALAALGFDRLLKGDDRLRRHCLAVACVAGGLALGAGALRLSLGSEDGPGPGWWVALVSGQREARKAEEKADGPAASLPMAGRSLGWSSLCAAALAGGLVVRRGKSSAAALALLLVGELWVFDSRYFVGHSLADMEWPPEFVSMIRNHPEYPFRIVTVTPQQTPSIGMCEMAGIDHLGGYDPMMLRRYTELMNVARGKPASDIVVAMMLARPGPLFDLMGARVWIVPGPKAAPPGWRALGELPSGIVYENPAALPRAFLVGRSVVIESAPERLKFLSGPSFDPRRVVVLESPLDAPLSGPLEVGGTVRLAEVEPGAYGLEVDCPVEAVLVLSEAWYPGWALEVDGAPRDLLRADHLIQAVRLPAGKHQVRFSYHPRFLGVGFALSALALLVPLGLAGFRKRRSG